MFQNMGPAPSGRSGHSMATAGSRVFVLGGESFTSQKADDPMVIHVLDTSTPSFTSEDRFVNVSAEHIKYPDPKTGQRRPSEGGQRPQPQGPPYSTERARSPPVSSDTDTDRRGMSPVGNGRIKLQNGTMQPFPTNQEPEQRPPGSRDGKRPPARPPRDEYGASELAAVRKGPYEGERVMSPEARSKSPTNMGSRAMSPTNGIPATQRDMTNAMLSRSGAGTVQARSPSPGAAPSDAFVYNKSAGINGIPNGRVSPVVGRPGSQSNIAADLIRDLRAKEELEVLKRREQWMRAALSKAAKAGFSWNDLGVEEGDDAFRGLENEGGEARKLVESVFRLKQERASLQVLFGSYLWLYPIHELL